MIVLEPIFKSTPFLFNVDRILHFAMFCRRNFIMDFLMNFNKWNKIILFICPFGTFVGFSRMRIGDSEFPDLKDCRLLLQKLQFTDSAVFVSVLKHVKFNGYFHYSDTLNYGIAGVFRCMELKWFSWSPEPVVILKGV